MTRTKSGVASTPTDDAAHNDVQHTVSVRVLPQGAGRVYTGERNDAAADAVDRVPTYGRGDVFSVERAIAEALEARGLVEIQP